MMRSDMNRLVRVLITVSAMVFVPVAEADVGISGLDAVSINAWAGATNDLVGSDTYCTISCTRSCRRARHRRDYDTAAYTNGRTDGAGNFYIRNGGDYMLVYLDWTHPTDGTVRLTNYSVTGQTTGPVTGAYDCVADSNSQTRVDITLPAAELATASAGTYSETFMLDVCRLSGGSAVECLAPVSFSVTLPELVQVTRLDNLNLGTWSGSGDIQLIERFCVFRNGTGGFSILTNGSHDSGGRFHLQDATTVPYTLEYTQGSGFFEATPGVGLPSATTGFAGNSTRDCGGADNTAIRVTIDAADLEGLPTGSFSDTLTLYLEPN